eukprot:scaffold111303_cov66-Phaeocystis_antarctica.AAC.2
MAATARCCSGRLSATATSSSENVGSPCTNTPGRAQSASSASILSRPSRIVWSSHDVESPDRVNVLLQQVDGPGVLSPKLEYSMREVCDRLRLASSKSNRWRELQQIRQLRCGVKQKGPNCSIRGVSAGDASEYPLRLPRKIVDRRSAQVLAQCPSFLGRNDELCECEIQGEGHQEGRVGERLLEHSALQHVAPCLAGAAHKKQRGRHKEAVIRVRRRGAPLIAIDGLHAHVVLERYLKSPELPGTVGDSKMRAKKGAGEHHAPQRRWRALSRGPHSTAARKALHGALIAHETITPVDG